MNAKKMNDRITPKEMCNVLETAIKMKILSEEDTAVVFYNISLFEQKLKEIRSLFPKNTLHAIAVKANPLTNILFRIHELGLGLEVASFPELKQAEFVGISPENIVFDSPVKTHQEINYALESGVNINIDNFSELSRVAAAITEEKCTSRIGIRINPQVGRGTILSTSIGDEYSKFGIPIKSHRKKVIDAFVRYKWLTGLHVHIGSQGMSIEQIVKGIRIVLDLAIEINSKKSSLDQITTIDIGGGLSVTYSSEQNSIELSDFVELLTKKCPELFNSKFKLITEFGRHIHANCGWAASKVEYVKDLDETRSLLTTHLGADMFIREVYNPLDWGHEISIADKNGNLKTSKEQNYMIGGPLCFGGDFLSRGIDLPAVNETDYILVRDMGAYTFSMWSRYNSRQMPKIIGYKTKPVLFSILKEREDINQVISFWK